MSASLDRLDAAHDALDYADPERTARVAGILLGALQYGRDLDDARDIAAKCLEAAAAERSVS